MFMLDRLKPRGVPRGAAEGKWPLALASTREEETWAGSKTYALTRAS